MASKPAAEKRGKEKDLRLAYAGIAVLAISWVVLLLAFPAFPGFSISDQFERQRVSEQMLLDGAFPQTLDIYEPAPRYVYAPLFDVAMAALVGVTGADYLWVSFAAGFAAMLLLFFAVYRLAGLFVPHAPAVLAGMAAALSPWVMRRLLYPLPETFGFVLVAAIAYCAFAKKYGWMTVLLVLAAALHTRSFITAAAVVAALLLVRTLQRRETKRFWIGTVAAAVATLPLFVVRPELFHAVGLENPWVFFPDVWSVFGALAVAGVAGALWFAWKKGRAGVMVAWAVLSVALVVALPHSISAFRTGAFAFIPLAVFGAYLAWEAASRAGKHQKTVFGALGVVLLAALFVQSYDIASQETYFTHERLALLSQLKQEPRGVVMADFIGSYPVPLVGGQPVVAGAFLEQLPDGTRRAQDTWDFFANCTPDPAILERYNVRYAYFSTYARLKFKCTLKDFDPKGTYRVVAQSETPKEAIIALE